MSASQLVACSAAQDYCRFSADLIIISWLILKECRVLSNQCVVMVGFVVAYNLMILSLK